MANEFNLTITIPVYNEEKLLTRALDSIPKRKDVQIIIIDDCSTDMTGKVATDWVNEHRDEFGEVILQINDKNMGEGYCKYQAYGMTKGKYCITLNSYDYLYTREYNRCIDYVISSGKDIVYINNDINNGTIWQQEARSSTWHYFIRTDFLKEFGMDYSPDVMRDGDDNLFNYLKGIPKEEEHLFIVAYHHNYPREDD